jgi:uncharacterized SAM-binding protein YcdF (DUF218 family)
VKVPSSSNSKWVGLKNSLAGIGALAIIAAISWVILLHFAMPLLLVHNTLAKADWIVLLGGESGERVIGAAELYHAGVAPQIFVTGGGDCVMNVERLEMAGVPAAKIAHECSAQSTYQNAIFTRAALNASNPQKVVLVTSWFHTRRALWTFQRVWPSIQYGVVGVVPGGTSYYWLPVHESGFIFSEYVKIFWYQTKCTVWRC